MRGGHLKPPLKMPASETTPTAPSEVTAPEAAEFVDSTSGIPQDQVPSARRIAERLRVAKESAATLNEATDRLNAALVEAETALADLRLGVQGYARMSDPDAEDNGYSVCLCFRKHDGKWSLVIDAVEETGEDRNTTPLVKASRADRLEAARLLPQLVDNMIAKVGSQVEEVNEEVANVRDLVAELRGARS
jgi:hypothetical protein